MARLRRNFRSGTITDNPLAAGATTINSPGFLNLPPVGAPWAPNDMMVLVLDPLGEFGTPEIVYVSYHGPDNDTDSWVTVTRGQEQALGGYAPRSHPAGTKWVLADSASDERLRVLGAGPAVVGSAPAANTGPFYMQAGTIVITTNGGGGGYVTFPVPFPNGVVAVTVTNGDASVHDNLIVGLTGSLYSVSGFEFVVTNAAGTRVGGFLMRMNWIAVGF